MSDPAEYQPIDGIPAPVLVVRGERIIHANPALLTLLGIGLSEVLSTPADQSWLEPMHTQYTRGLTTPEKLWVRVRVAEEQERTYCMSRGEGVRAEDTLLMFVDAEGEASTLRLTESLVEAAGELLKRELKLWGEVIRANNISAQ